MSKFFCRHIAEAIKKNLQSPRHFIGDVPSTWVSKADISNGEKASTDFI